MRMAFFATHPIRKNRSLIFYTMKNTLLLITCILVLGACNKNRECNCYNNQDVRIFSSSQGTIKKSTFEKDCSDKNAQAVQGGGRCVIEQ